MVARREQGVWVNSSDERATIIVNPDGTPVSAGGGGGVSIVDDEAFTVGVSSLTVAGGIVTADSVDAGDAGAFAMLANRQQKITLYDSSGVEITSFGGGTQYTEGATDASITGTAILFEGAADTLIAAPGDAANGLDVDVTRVSGSVAVTNAGLTELAAAIDTELQVDVVGALPAGTNNIGDVDVLSVVPGTGATNLGKAEDGAHSSGDVGVMALGVYQSSQADFGADGDYVPLSIDDAGGVRVSIVAGAGSGGTAAADDADFTATTTQGTPAMGVYESAPSSVTDGDLGIAGITQTRALRTVVEGTVTVGSHAVTNAGTFAVQDATAQASLSVLDDWDESDRAKVNPIAGQAGVQGASGTVTALTQRVVLATDVALPAGTNGIGKLTANSGVDIGDVDVTSISAGTNAIGNVGLIGRTTGGLTIFRSLDIDETEEEIKGTAGQVFSIAAFNRTAAPLYLKFYNATAANVTVGSTTPVLTFLVPANADSDGAGYIWNNSIGYAFGTAITVACTTGIADADSGAPGANDCLINVGYA